MKKKTTPLQYWDRFIGWLMMGSAALFVGSFVWGLLCKM